MTSAHTLLRATALTPAELDHTADAVRRDRCEGYPVASDRLRIDSPGLHLNGTGLIVPDGPWHVHNHPNRRAADPAMLDPEIPGPGHLVADADQRARRSGMGLAFDQHGRPLHPHWLQLLTDPRIGLPTGIGYFYRYGPNQTVDAVIYRHRTGTGLQVLLIRRRDGGRWALPGGYRDPADTSATHTARREAAEETGLDRIGGRAETLAHTRSTGPAATLHAWTENTVILLHGDPAYLTETEPAPGDDATDARWTSPADLAGLDLYDHHHSHITTALRRIEHAAPAVREAA